MSEGLKTVLNQAVEAHRQSDAAPALRQGELFALPHDRRTELDAAIDQAKTDEAIVEQAWREAEAESLQQDSGPKRGRPKGARNVRSEEAAKFYVRRHGDPLEQAVKLGAIPILAKGVLEALAQRLGTDRLNAAKFWANNNQAVLPYLRPRLAALEVKPAGSPESSEAVLWEDWNYIDGELVDSTTSQDKALSAQDTVADIIEPAPDTVNSR